MPGRRLDPRREQQRAGPVAGRSRVACGIERGRMRCAPRLSPRTIHAQPNPLTMRSARSGSRAALQASAASMLARSARAKDRCSAWRALRTPAWTSRPRRRTMRRARRAPRSVSPASVIASTREGADAVEQPVAGRARVAVIDDHQRTARESPDHVDRGRRGDVEGFEHRLDRRERRAAGERGQRPQAPLVVGEQQLVAPPDRRPERSASLRLAAGRVAQHAEAIVEATGDLLRPTTSWCAPRRARSPAAGRRATGTGRAPRHGRRAGRRGG